MRVASDSHANLGAGASTPAPKVSISGLSKRYGGVQALADVGFDAMPGSIHAVVGENGAGKSTLMKILAGAVRPDSGTILLDGEPFEASTPHAAHARGVGIVYQELSLFPDRSVLANLFPDREATRFGLISLATMERTARPMLREIGLQVPVSRPVGFLPIGEQQLVELCRVLLSRPSVLILDEPNSALSEQETERLFAVLRKMRDSGITMFYVSHRLEEVFAIADTVTVMRNGSHVFTRPRAELTIPDVVRAMLGREEEALYPARSGAERRDDAAPGRVTVSGLAVRPSLKDVSFEAHAGEIVGLAGIQGSGVSDLLGALFGVRRAVRGSVTYPDGRGLPGSATQSARRGVSLVPSDRRHQGLMLEHTIAQNISQVRGGALGGFKVWLGRSEMARAAQRQIDALRIKTPSPWSQVHHLSGGNQQKVVVGKWLEINPGVILLDDPARGVDVGAKQEIFALVRALADEGKIVLFHSTEVPELIGLSDRIVGLYRGRVVVDQPVGELDASTLLHAINTGEPPGHNGGIT
jgi:ABC-type sugar transport system ATPase subunit